MEHIQTIVSEFSRLAMKKVARKWDDLSYEEQRGYLSRHPKSKRRMTARPSGHAKLPETTQHTTSFKEANICSSI